MKIKSAHILTKDKLHLIPEVIDIHAQALGDTLLFNLGKNYLKRYYESSFQNPNRSLIYIKEKRVAGYIFMSYDRQQYSTFLTFYDILFLTRNIFLKPSLSLDIFKVMHNRYFLEKDEAEISQFAVSPSFQSKGVGKKILCKTIQVAKKDGKRKLVTVTHNLHLIDFYKKKFNAAILKKISLHQQCYYLLKWKI